MQHTPTKNRLPTRLTAWLLALVMVMTMLPGTALASGSTGPPAPAETEQQITDTPDTPGTPDTPDTPDTPEAPVGADDSVRPEPPEEPVPDPGVTATEEMTASQPAMLAGGTDQTYGFVLLDFHPLNGESSAIKLYSGNYITACDPGATVWSGNPNNQSDYLVWYHEGILYLNGNLQDVRISLYKADRFPNESQRSVLVYVKDNVTMSGCGTLLDLQDSTNATLHIDPGKRLTLNLTRNAQSTTRGAAIYGAAGSNLTVIGGGELHINAYGSGDKSGSYTYTFGIALRGDLTLSSGIHSAGSPDVQIKVSNDSTNTESDKVFGVDVYGLTVKDESFLKIDVTGRALDPKTEGDSYSADATWGRVNGAISAGSMKLLDKASVDIISRKNVVSDIALTGGGEVLRVDTGGYFHITNHGNITRYPDDDDDDDHKHKLFDHPDANIYLPAKEATANIVRVEEGMVIDSYSRIVNRWYDEVINGTEQWNWVIGRGYQGGGSIGIEPTLGTHMYVGTRRVGEAVEVNASDHRYTWGQYEYIYSPAGVVTVQQSSGLTMDWEKPEGSASSVDYARVREPGFNDIYIVHKGADLSLEAPEGKGKFLYWYDALHPTGSGSTSWTKPNQTFTNIRQDMVLVPVRDPMKTGPDLSDVGYKEHWDSDLKTYIRYAYQDLTFAKEDNISNSGGYRVMLVPAQLPTYGEKTYAVKNLNGSPVMGLGNSRLYADAKGSDVYGTQLSARQIAPGSYRIAYYDNDTTICFFSKPFKFDPPVAPPYIDPVTQFYDSGGTKQVKITAERGAPIKYCLWDYTKNTWGGYIPYTEPFNVTVTSEQDVRIKAYAGPTIKNITSEVRYALRPTGVPTVKYGDTVLSTTDANLPNRYFYDSIELTVEVPEGYEVWYLVGDRPSESNMGNKVGKDGKVTITDSGSHGILYFKLAKAFTVDGREYRKLSHQSTSVHLSKIKTLPAPKVTVKTKEGSQTLFPSGNTYTMTENVVTVKLEPNGNWPLNATIAYDTNGNASPTFSKSYTAPFDLRGAGTLAVFTLVPKAGGGYEYERKECIFKLAENLQTVPVSTYGGNCTAYYMNESGSWTQITGGGHNLKVGTRVRVVPKPSGGQVFKRWEIGNYEEWHIWGAYGAGDYHSPELIFHVPSPINDYNHKPKTLSITATFASAAEANISGVTKVDLVMKDKAVGESISLNYSNKEMRTISCQWWEGDRVGTNDEALLSWVTFDPGKTYTVKVTITANPGASFADSAGVAIGNWGEHFTVPNGKITRTGKDTLTFTATPVRQIDLTMPAPLTVGEPLPTTAQVHGLPEGVTVQKLEWSNTPGNTVPDAAKVYAALTLKSDGTHPILVGEYKNLAVNGVGHVYARNGSSGNYYTVINGSTVKAENIDLPVKPKGVTVSGTAVSWNATDDALYYLYPSTMTDADIRAQWKNNTYASGAALYTGTGGAITATTVDGKSMKAQTFSFGTIPAGEYKLVIFKPGKYVPKIVPITVESTALDLGQLKLWLYGDVNYDGAIKAIDVTMARQYFKGNLSSLTDEQICAIDMNGDGSIKAIDITILRQYFKGNISTIPVA